MRDDKGEEKGEEGISNRFNRRNEVDRPIIGCMNGAVCNCGYGTEENEDKKQSVRYWYNNFETGKEKVGKLRLSDEIVIGMKEGKVERRINDEREKDRQ